jgi:hypothetical protein
VRDLPFNFLEFLLCFFGSCHAENVMPFVLLRVPVVNDQPPRRALRYSKKNR